MMRCRAYCAISSRDSFAIAGYPPATLGRTSTVSPALTPPLVERARRGERMLEIGAGKDWSTAEALAKEGAAVVVSDVDPEVLLAPPHLHAVLLDAARPDLALVGEPDLVYAIRVP